MAKRAAESMATPAKRAAESTATPSAATDSEASEIFKRLKPKTVPSWYKRSGRFYQFIDRKTESITALGHGWGGTYTRIPAACTSSGINLPEL